MAKESFYFSHDYGARNDPKLQKVIMTLNHEGKSVYWDIIEMLYEESGYLLLAEIDSYAFALRTTSEVIKTLINDFGLFQKNELKFWSESVLKRMDKREEIKEKRRLSAQKRWGNANAMQMQCIDNANAMQGKEIKGKEIKGKEIENKKEIKTKVRDDVFEDSILKFFGFSVAANFNHARTVSAFVSVLENQGRLEYFKTQFKAYCEYKNKNGYKHSMQKFLGDQSERFENGMWDSENWAEKLKPVEEPKKPTGFILGQKPVGYVDHRYTPEENERRRNAR